MLMKASRYTNASFSLPMEQMDRHYSEKEREEVLSAYDAAKSSNNLAQLHMAVEKVKGFVRRLMEAQKSASAEVYSKYQQVESEEIRVGRETQACALTEFFDQLGRRIEEQSVVRGTMLQAQSVAGFWISFVEAWRRRATAASAEDLDAVIKQGMGFGESISATVGAPEIGAEERSCGSYRDRKVAGSTALKGKRVSPGW